MIIDSHIHLNAPDYKENFDDYLNEAKRIGIEYFICVGAGYGADSAKQAVELAEKYDCIYASVGIHPHDADDDFDFKVIEELSTHPKVVAIGETGLDYFRMLASKENQFKYFRKQIELSQKVNKPLIIHSREAAEDCITELTNLNAKTTGGVFHCFSENADFAKRLANINFMVSFPGVITFNKAEETREAAKNTPLSQLMIETDGPYLSPTPYRGKLCKPEYIIETAKKLAEIKDMPLSELTEKLTENTIKFYSLPIKTC